MNAGRGTGAGSPAAPGSPAPSTASASTVPARSSLVLLTLILVASVANLNLAVANVALPDIGKAFNASQTQLDLVAVAYSLGLAASVLYFGAIGDRYGRKLLLVVGMAVSLPAALIAAFAPSVQLLMAGRVLGGLAAGMAYPTTLALITALGGGQYGSQELNAIKALYQQQQLAAQRAMNAKQISARGAAATLPINKELAYTTDAAADANSANAGLAQSPGAVAAARAGALAPLAEQNVQVGQENARFGFPYQFQTQAPDYLSVLQQLNTLGRNTGPYSLPGAV